MLKCKSCGKEFEYSGNKRLCEDCRQKHKEQCVKYRRDKERGFESKYRLSENEKQKIVQLALNGYATKEIVPIVGRELTTIYKTLKEYNVKAVKKYSKPISEETKQLEQLVIEYRKQGIGQRQIAKLTGKTKEYIGEICRRCGVGGVLAEKTQGTNPVEYVQRYTNEFEYVSGWVNCESKAVVRCKKCGTEFEMSMKTMRSTYGRCPKCLEQERELIRAQKEAQKNAELELKRKEKQRQKEQRFWSKSFDQTAFKICPVCGSLFMSGKKYCSQECQNYNHWKSREGYRYLFPLEEVFKRDNGICYLCGEPCDWNDYKTVNGIVIYGNNYPSRDHVKPKSKGGKNTWSNIRLAHRRCNSKKYTKVIC